MEVDHNPLVIDWMRVDKIDFSASMISHEISRKSEAETPQNIHPISSLGKLAGIA
jgi:hypothetical protein